jgi:hypothetical protein
MILLIIIIMFIVNFASCINTTSHPCDDIYHDPRKVELSRWNYGRLGNTFISAKIAMTYALHHGCNLQLPLRLFGLNGLRHPNIFFASTQSE